MFFSPSLQFARSAISVRRDSRRAIFVDAPEANSSLMSSSRDIDVVSIDEFDPQRALGLWHILATNLNMWKSKLTPTITYTLHESSLGRVQMDDLVEYYTRRPFVGFVQTNVKGVDTQLAHKASRFQWRGNGALKFVTSDFGFIFVDETTPADQPYEWVAIMFGPTLFTSAGIDLMTRTRQPSTEILNNFVRLCRENPLVRPKALNMFYTREKENDSLYYIRDLQTEQDT